MQVFFPSFTFNTIKHSKEYRTLCPYFERAKSKKNKETSKKQSCCITIDLNLRKTPTNERTRQKIIKSGLGLYNSLGSPKTIPRNRKRNDHSAKKNQQSEKKEEALKNNFQPTKLRLSKSISNTKKKERKRDKVEKGIFTNSFVVTKKLQHTDYGRPKTQRMLRYTPSNVKYHKKHISEAVYELNEADCRPWSPKKQDIYFEQVNL